MRGEVALTVSRPPEARCAVALGPGRRGDALTPRLLGFGVEPCQPDVDPVWRRYIRVVRGVVGRD